MLYQVREFTSIPGLLTVFFLIFIFTLFYFTILCWFCHTLTWIHHGCTCDPKHEPPSHLPPHNIPLGHPRAPAPSMLSPASDIDWWFNSYMIVYMFQCHSPKSSHPLPLPLSPFLKKSQIELPYDPAIPLLGIHTEETRIERDTCTPMFIAALFIITRTWKQPRCPSADEWIRKLWYIYTMEYYSAFKKNTFESVLKRWMKLEPIIQSEVSQKEKHQYSILTHIYGI